VRHHNHRAAPQSAWGARKPQPVVAHASGATSAPGNAYLYMRSGDCSRLHRRRASGWFCSVTERGMARVKRLVDAVGQHRGGQDRRWLRSSGRTGAAAFGADADTAGDPDGSSGQSGCSDRYRHERGLRACRTSPVPVRPPSAPNLPLIWKCRAMGLLLYRQCSASAAVAGRLECSLHVQSGRAPGANCSPRGQ
jgi:hypothetical protein